MSITPITISISVINQVYKPTNITGGPHIVTISEFDISEKNFSGALAMGSCFPGAVHFALSNSRDPRQSNNNMASISQLQVEPMDRKKIMGVSRPFMVTK